MAAEIEKTVLICMPVTVKGYIVPGSLKVKCDRCPQLVWVAPSGWLIPNKEILCWSCAIPQLEKDKDAVIKVTTAQLDEIREYNRIKQEGG